jgi:hypothetical protein
MMVFCGRRPGSQSFWTHGPLRRVPAHGRFTTVMQWQSYEPLEYAGTRYGMKAHSFMPYVNLPRRSAGARFDLAVDGLPDAGRTLLEKGGWTLRDPYEPTQTTCSYQRYIQESKAEFSVAKQGYVTARTGWFSERSAAYLASGRPVVTQDTGFSEWLQPGEGLISFQTVDEAVGAIERVNRRYEHHCRAARNVAREYFDSRVVLSHLIERAMSKAAG